MSALPGTYMYVSCARLEKEAGMEPVILLESSFLKRSRARVACAVQVGERLLRAHELTGARDVQRIQRDESADKGARQ